MIPRRLIRPLALLGAIAIASATAASCSSTTNDAATITFKDKHGTHTIHITRADFESEMRGIAKDKALVSALAASNGGQALVDKAGDGSESTDSDLTATWLRILIAQRITDSLFQSAHLTLNDFDKQNAPALASGGMPTEAAFLGLSKKLQKTLTSRAERTLAVARSTCNSGKAIAQIVVAKKAQADAVVAQLKSATDFNKTFGDLVQNVSTDAESKQSNGLRGCFDPADYGQYGTMLDSQPPNTAVDPIQNGGSYYVFVLTPWRADMPNTQTTASKSVQEEQADISDLLLRAKVHIDPRYGTWDSGVSAQGPFAQVVPPGDPNPKDCREKICPTTTTAAPTTTIPLPGG
jgi:hypothetical protein